MQIPEKFFDYLEKNLKHYKKVTKKDGRILFTCPNLSAHAYPESDPTANLMPGNERIQCFVCGYKGTMFDVVRFLEEDKKCYSDAQIVDYLSQIWSLNAYPEIETYDKYKWALVPIAKNSKAPFEKDWTNIEHRDKIQWIKWLNNELNIGLRTGKVNNILVFDFDLAKIATNQELRNQLLEQFKQLDTLTANTPHGKHFIVQYEVDIPQTTDIANLKIDTRNDGGQILIAPSKRDGLAYVWQDINKEIKKLPDSLKANILELLKVDRVEVREMLGEVSILSTTEETLPTLKNNNLDGCCNDTFIRIGGVLINKLSPEQTRFVLHVLNKNLLANPMKEDAVDAMSKSLGGYKATEEETQERAIYDYVKLLQGDITARDVVDSLKLSRSIVDKYLSKLTKEGKIIRIGRGRYQYKEQITWSDEAPANIEEYKYKIPLFNDIAVFQDGDVLILGGAPNVGKTTIAINMLREMILQGVKPYYLFTEATSRWLKTANDLGITSKFFYRESINPLTIELESNAFTIIDWLDLGKEGFEKTSVTLEYLATEMRKKKGILVIFTQLKPSNGDWFAPNLIEQYPTFSARYFQDNDSKTQGHWDVQKIKEPRANYTTYQWACEYDSITKIFKAKSPI
jgi:hypothetical protein